MTVTPPLLDVDGRRRTLSIWIGLIAATVFVATGAGIALSTLAPVPTPANVAKTFLEAESAHDSATIWALMCESTRTEIGDYTEFVRGVGPRDRYEDDYESRSPDVDIDIDYLHGVRGPGGPSLALAVTTTHTWPTGEVWEGTGQLLVVEEAGEYRVCDKGGYLW
jgi:hypothetical protein